MAERHGAELAVPDWRERLRLFQVRQPVDFVVTGTARR
jgi:hypothetical protein